MSGRNSIKGHVPCSPLFSLSLPPSLPGAPSQSLAQSLARWFARSLAPSLAPSSPLHTTPPFSPPLLSPLPHFLDSSTLSLASRESPLISVILSLTSWIIFIFCQFALLFTKCLDYLVECEQLTLCAAGLNPDRLLESDWPIPLGLSCARTRRDTEGRLSRASILVASLTTKAEGLKPGTRARNCRSVDVLPCVHVRSSENVLNSVRARARARLLAMSGKKNRSVREYSNRFCCLCQLRKRGGNSSLLHFNAQFGDIYSKELSLWAHLARTIRAPG